MVSLVEGMLAAKKQLQLARTDRDKDFYTNKCAALDRPVATIAPHVRMVEVEVAA